MEISQIFADQLDLYASIPMKYCVASVLKIEPLHEGLGGLSMTEERLGTPYLKDYDASETPLRWSKQFDISQWGIFLLQKDNLPVAGAAVARNTPLVNMLENRKDLAVLWDIRVHPDWQRKGLGTRIFRHAASWAKQLGCTQMKIETQNVNVPACRFYARQGCILGGINRFGYAGCPSVAHEAMLLWYLYL